MYPNTLFLNFDLYTIFLCLGLVSAVVVFRMFADKKRLHWRLQNFCVFTAAASMFVGYFSAVLFQALYNIKDEGKFVINTSTGATFYGGLIGGAACFLAIYFGLGYFMFRDREKVKFDYLKNFFVVADIAAASISMAHALGRLGCLMAGCCHGAETDAWYGIYMPALEAKVVPLQLYEAIFLFLLFAIFVYRLIKNKSGNLPLYMAAYGAWRFVIEYFRTDDRGNTVVSFLSPSQFIALLMIVGAIVLFFGQRYIVSKQSAVKPEVPDEK